MVSLGLLFVVLVASSYAQIAQQQQQVPRQQQQQQVFYPATTYYPSASSMAQAPSAETMAATQQQDQQTQQQDVQQYVPVTQVYPQTYDYPKTQPQYIQAPVQEKKPAAVATNYYGQPLIGYLAPVTLSGAGAGLVNGIGYGAVPLGLGYGGAPFGSGYYSPYGMGANYAPINTYAAPAYTASAIPTSAPFTAAETAIPADYFNMGPDIVTLAPSKKQQQVAAPIAAQEIAVPVSAPISAPKQEVISVPTTKQHVFSAPISAPKTSVPTKIVSAPQAQPLFQAKAHFGFQAPSTNFGFPTGAFNTPFIGTQNKQQPPIILVQPQVTVQKPVQQAPNLASQQQQTSNVLQVTVRDSDDEGRRRESS